MLSEILTAIFAFFNTMLSMVGFGSDNRSIESNTLRVFIKNGPKTISVELSPSWNIRKVKEIIAPQLGLVPEEVKIIFAGKELPDSLILDTCDVGQQSFLHAVKVHIINKSEDETLKNMEKLKLEETQVEKCSSESSGSCNSRSHFFVYCSTCDGLKEGKLRVRCAKCQSGAFTVIKNPDGWDDVLIPNRIEGNCESCPNKFTQFYFKCADHITAGEDDSASPLSLIKRNSELVPCLACGDAKDIVIVFKCPSAHVSCIDCFQQYCTIKINQRGFVQDSSIGYSVGCPVLCRNSLIKDSHHFKLMGKHDYERYQRFATEECVFQMGGLLCPQPDCGMGIIPMDTNCNKIACLHGCNFVFCRLCLEGWHLGPCTNSSSTSSVVSKSEDGRGFPISQERVAQSLWDDATRRAFRMTTKPCPKCRVPTEKFGGCMHLDCTKCGYEWCWVCQNKWTRDCMGNHWFS